MLGNDETTPPPSAPGVLDELSASSPRMRDAATQVATQQREDAQARATARKQGRPPLSLTTVVPFLDWVVGQYVGDVITGPEATILMRAAELVVSTGHAAAQGKPADPGLEPPPAP